MAPPPPAPAAPESGRKIPAVVGRGLGSSANQGPELGESSATGRCLRLEAPAKTNLSLRVLGRREDGYHAIETIMTRLSLADELVLRAPRPGEEPGLRCSDPSLPTDDNNLVVKAWRRLEEEVGRELPLVLELTKNIPHGAGLGGGSSDAAATLRGIDQWFGLKLGAERLREIGAELGSDVPFFLHDGACCCRGRGEEIERLPEFDWELPIVLLKPPYGISAAEAYQGWAEGWEPAAVSTAPQICPWGAMVNDLERPVFAKYLQLAVMKEWLRAQPEVWAPLLSGSGSTMLAVLAADRGGAELIERARAEFGPELWAWVGRTRVG